MNGNRLWSDWGFPVSAAPNLNLSVDYYHNMVAVEPGAAVIVWTDTRTGSSLNNQNVYMARIDGSLATGLAENQPNLLAEIFPNPSTGNFTLTFSDIVKQGTVEIFNTMGKNIFTDNILNTSEISFNLRNISDGIYLVKVKSGEQVSVKRLVVQH